MDRRDTRYRDVEIQSRVALHKRKHIPVFIARDPIPERTESLGFRRESSANLIVAEIYTTGTTGSREKRVETSARMAPFRRFFSIVSDQLTARCRRCCMVVCVARATMNERPEDKSFRFK